VSDTAPGFNPTGWSGWVEPIGRLRWPVVIAKRADQPAGAATIAESLTDVLATHADIQPVGGQTFLAGQQTDRPITHRVILRWLDWLDETFVILRRTLRRDRTVRTEVFRVRRIMEAGGRKRFLVIEAELESRF